MEKFGHWAHGIVDFFNFIGSICSISSDNGAVFKLCDIGIFRMAIENLE